MKGGPRPREGGEALPYDDGKSAGGKSPPV